MADPCAEIYGRAKQYCERGESGKPPSDGDSSLGGMFDPVSSAADWLSDQAAALYRQMDRLMMSGASPLDGFDAHGVAGVYNPVAGLSLLIGTIVLLGGIIFWMARPSGPNFRKAGQAGGRYLGLILLATAAPIVIAFAAYGLGQLSTLVYADIADHPFKGMEKTLIGSDGNPWGRIAQSLVVVGSVGPLWLMCQLTKVGVLAAMVFVPLVAAFGVSRGWLQSTTLRRLLHLVCVVYLARIPVAIVLMFRPLMPKGAVTDLLLTASTGLVCVYVLVNLPSVAQKATARITRMPKVKAHTQGRTTVTKMPADRERTIHAKNLSALHTPGNRPWNKPTSGEAAKPQRAAEPRPRVNRPTTITEERSRRVRVPDVPAGPAVRDRDPQAPAHRG
ncbi:hypothetical protein ACTWJ8_13415 [Streptomyces sp. SDT5-1]|uniref:hypothetical protein n=1 Tax=Streptomyces sp. SDT5-1 TaxID=3406418 RepID=UPI003FD3A74A